MRNYLSGFLRQWQELFRYRCKKTPMYGGIPSQTVYETIFFNSQFPPPAQNIFIVKLDLVYSAH